MLCNAKLEAAMEMKGLLAVNDNSMSNLTSTASGEICASSGSGSEIYGNNNNLYSHHSFASANHQPSPPPKKKRNLPGNPDPDAEVIALSPKTLMATNRFICEIQQRVSKGPEPPAPQERAQPALEAEAKTKGRTDKEEGVRLPRADMRAP